MKICCNCKKYLSAQSFASSKRPGGLQAQCRECQRIYRKEHYIQNRQKYITKAAKRTKDLRDWFKNYKKQFKCSKCNESESICLDFHHPDDNKENGVAELISNGNKDSILKEIEKCIVLCANCHRKHHAGLI